MLLKIPADLTIVTLKDDNQTYPNRFTPQFAKQLLANASYLLQSRANTRFTLGECTAATAEVPPGTRADALDDTGFHFLAAKYRAGNGVHVLLVDKMARNGIGGRAREEERITILPFGSNVSSTSRKLAHEFCHLLGIEKHINEGASPEPGKEAEWADMSRNLMYSGSLNPDALLTPAQVATMRSSRLARQFGRSSIGDMFIPEILRSIRRI